jgi:hypothetical protein
MTATKLATTMALSGWYLYTYNEFAFKVAAAATARHRAWLTLVTCQVLGLVSPVAQAVGNTVKRVVILVRAPIPSRRRSRAARRRMPLNLAPRQCPPALYDHVHCLARRRRIFSERCGGFRLTGGCGAGCDVDRVRDADDAHRHRRIVHRHGELSPTASRWILSGLLPTHALSSYQSVCLLLWDR